GSGKRTGPEQRRFYGIALGSLRECKAILDLEEIESPDLLRAIDHLGAILYVLTRDPPPTGNGRENRYGTETETETATDAGQKTETVPTTDSVPVLVLSPEPKKKPAPERGGGPS
ncbi:MAG: hypothetical protein ACXWP1_07365, partial [Bdellovibrionota bacterium]